MPSLSAEIAPWLSPKPSASAPTRISVGCMNFGKRTSEEESHRVVRRALERGYRFFDTANVYNDGESERILGRALGKQRSDCFIATKVGLNGIPKKREGLGAAVVKRSIDESIARLGTDYVDLYYLHAPDPETPIEETVLAMKEVLADEKARAWGVSNYASWQILEIDQLCDQHGVPRPVVAQMLYNLLIRQLDVEYFAFARRYPLHTTVYNPLAGGILAGKHQEGVVPKGSRFDKNAMYLRRYWSPRFFELVASIGEVASEEGMSPVELAYAWVAGHPGVDSVLLGPADVAQLDAGIEGCGKSVSPAAKKKLDELYTAFQGTDATYAR